MDFFEQQEKAKRQTAILVTYFGLAILGMVFVVQVAFAFVLGVPFWDLNLLVFVTGGVLLVVMTGSLAKWLELSRGGRVVAQLLGGEKVNPATRDREQRRLLNVVEEMAIASGLPVPDVYILPEDSINAFAAGHSPSDAVVGVTSGALHQLTRSELQGVVGHEFSHILHGDMRLNIRLMALLNGILGLAILGRVFVRGAMLVRQGRRPQDSKGGHAVSGLFFAAGVVLFLAGWAGVFFGRLIKAAVSRQREFLADAAAVQFTRDPMGLVSALVKIKQMSSRVGHPRAAEVSHMFFCNGLGDSFLNLFATHPPIEERIRRIAPGFEVGSLGFGEVSAKVSEKVLGVNRGACEVVTTSGTLLPTALSRAAGAAMLAGLPELTRQSVRHPREAMGLVLAFLLSRDEEQRRKQLERIVNVELREIVEREFEGCGELSGIQKLALVDLAFPALHELTRGDYEKFRQTVGDVAACDGKIELFEFVVMKILELRLERFFSATVPVSERYCSLLPVLPAVNVLLSLVAVLGNEDEALRGAAFERGVESLGVEASQFPMQLLRGVGVKELEEALEEIGMATPLVKRRVLEAVARVVADEGIRESEYEILRLVAEVLECPMPLLVD